MIEVQGLLERIMSKLYISIILQLVVACVADKSLCAL